MLSILEIVYIEGGTFVYSYMIWIILETYRLKEERSYSGYPQYGRLYCPSFLFEFVVSFSAFSLPNHVRINMLFVGCPYLDPVFRLDLCNIDFRPYKGLKSISKVLTKYGI